MSPYTAARVAFALSFVAFLLALGVFVAGVA